MRNYVPFAYSRKTSIWNGESDSLCGKICDMHTFGKYANNATIAYSHKTGMPNCVVITDMLEEATVLQSGIHCTEHTTTIAPVQ